MRGIGGLALRGFIVRAGIRVMVTVTVRIRVRVRVRG